MCRMRDSPNGKQIMAGSSLASPFVNADVDRRALRALAWASRQQRRCWSEVRLGSQYTGERMTRGNCILVQVLCMFRAANEVGSETMRARRPNNRFSGCFLGCCCFFPYRRRRGRYRIYRSNGRPKSILHGMTRLLATTIHRAVSMPSDSALPARQLASQPASQPTARAALSSSVSPVSLTTRQTAHPEPNK